MKPILYSLLLSVFLNSCYKIELFKPSIENIKIEGTVCDANNNLLENVEIILYGSTISSSNVHIEEIYSNDGTYKVEFTPKGMWNYWLVFEKKEYKNQVYRVNLDKEFQNFNVIMEKE